MSFKVSIAGIEVGAFPRGMHWTDRLGSIPTATLQLKLNSGDALPQRGQEIIIYDDEVQETVNMTQPVEGPPGLVYKEDNEGYLEVVLPNQAHADGSMEAIFTTLYNLPDISEYVSADEMVPGAMLYNGNDYSSWVEVGVVWKNVAKNYRFYVRLWSHVGVSFYETYLESTTVLELSRAYRLSVTWDTALDGNSCDLRFYVDGELEDQDTGTGTMAGYYATPNRAIISGAYAFLGIGYYFADFRLFLDARTPEEIDAWKFTRLTGAELSSLDLEGYWMADEMTGTVLADSSTYGNDATMFDDGSGYMAWDTCPDPWLPGSAPTCAPEMVDYRYFGGYIDKASNEEEGPGSIAVSITGVGYASILDRYRVGLNFLNPHQGKYYAQYITDNVVDAWGIGSACIPSGSPSVLVSDWKNKFCLAAMNEVSSSTNWLWYVDPYKELRYHPRGYKAAPFDITASDSPAYYMPGSLKVSEDRDGYYNRIYARFRYYDDILEENKVITIMMEDTVEIAARATAEGGDGVYEHYADLPDALTPEHALDQAYGMLSAACVMGKTVSYVTVQAGLRAGQTQMVTLPDQGLSGEFIVEEVRAEYRDGYIFYTVNLSSWAIPKVEPLTKLLGDALSSKTNWWESVLVDGTGELLPLSEGINMLVDDTIWNGDIESRVDYAEVDFSEVG